MLRIFNDPLLSVTQGLLRVAYIALFSIAVLLGVGVCIAVLTGDQLSRFSTVTPEHRHAGTIVVLATVPALALFGWFLRILRQIVRTVALGTPFVAENADRLVWMGSLALALKGVAVAERLMLGDGRVIAAPEGGILLALTLFILARVFRQGAAMRADLEGTI